MAGRGWTPAHLAALGLAAAAGLAVRAVLAPSPGLGGDLDQFIAWVHGIAVHGWPGAYDQSLSFPAVMAWVWGALALVEPAFATVSDASDPAVNALMKAPAIIADLGIAAGVAWWFRDRPRLAVVAAAAVLLWPATWYISAYWGQYEPLYVLPVLLAVLVARSGRPVAAAALLAVGLLTKPQALPLAVPFAAWLLATGGWRTALRGVAAGLAVGLAAWAPFLAAGGPGNYLRNLGEYQGSIFAILSMRAWNPWWVVQELLAGGDFVLDSGTLVGPVTFRVLGLGLAAIVALAVFVGVYRRPTAQNLAMGLAAIALGSVVTLTTMHDRYAYPTLVFLLLCWPRREVVAAWLAFAVAFAANLVYAVPPPALPPLPAERVVSVVGSVVITAVALAAVRWTWRGEGASNVGEGAA